MKKLTLALTLVTVLYAGKDIEPLVDYDQVDLTEAVEKVQVTEIPDIPTLDLPEEKEEVKVEQTPKTGWYGGLGVAGVKYSYCINQYEYGIVSPRVGYTFNDYIGVEIRGGVGLFHTDVINYRYDYEAVVKLSHPVFSKAFKPYATVGYGQSGFNLLSTDKFTPVDSNIIVRDIVYGAGVSSEVNDDISVYVDYTKLFDNERVMGYNEKTDTKCFKTIELEKIEFGAVYKF